MIKFTDWEEKTLPQRTKEAILKHVEYAKKRGDKDFDVVEAYDLKMQCYGEIRLAQYDVGLSDQEVATLFEKYVDLRVLLQEKY